MKASRKALGGVTAIAVAAVIALHGNAQEGKQLTLTEVKARLKEQRDKIKGLYVEYSYKLEPKVDADLLVRWRIAEVEEDYKFQAAFDGARRYFHINQAKNLDRLPGKHHAVDPDAPADVQEEQRKQRENLAESLKANGRELEETPTDKAHPFEFTNAFNGKRAWNKNQLGMYVWYAGEGRISSFGRRNARYFQNVGLLHPDPTMTPGDQTRFWLLPDALELGSYRVLDKPETIDAARCLVIEGKAKTPAGRERPRWAEGEIKDKFWLDLDHGLALRRRELTSADGRLLERSLNGKLKEVVPGVWLPQESEWQQGPPPWAKEELRGKPAAAFRMKVTKLVVNEGVKGDLFEPPANVPMHEIK